MVQMDDKTISLGTLVAMLALLASGFTAWADVKSDIAVNGNQIETNETQNQKIADQLSHVNDKLDRLIEGMLDEERKSKSRP